MHIKNELSVLISSHRNYLKECFLSQVQQPSLCGLQFAAESQCPYKNQHKTDFTDMLLCIHLVSCLSADKPTARVRSSVSGLILSMEKYKAFLMEEKEQNSGLILPTALWPLPLSNHPDLVLL